MPMNHSGLSRSCTGSIAGVMLGAILCLGPARAQENPAEQPPPPRVSWSFAGPFGTYDTAQLQRGYQVYHEVCAACHSMKLVAFRNLSQRGGPAFSPDQVKALAATVQVNDGPNDKGEMFQRPGRPADYFPSPYPNEAAARATLGAAPPDMSVLAKARGFQVSFPFFLFDALPLFSYQEQGPDYIHALMNGYEDTPKDFKMDSGLYYNRYIPGHRIAMPKPLGDGAIDYTDGSPKTVEQYSQDVTAFLMWAAEPKLPERKRTGLMVMVYLVMLAGLLYLVKRRIWSRLEGHGEGPGPAAVAPR
jgi:cytochrome c1